jgi:hypothetical protein
VHGALSPWRGTEQMGNFTLPYIMLRLCARTKKSIVAVARLVLELLIAEVRIQFPTRTPTISVDLQCITWPSRSYLKIYRNPSTSNATLRSLGATSVTRKLRCPCIDIAFLKGTATGV